MRFRWVALLVALGAAAVSAGHSGSYQVPPSGIQRENYAVPPPAAAASSAGRKQTYGTPPPRVYNTPPPQTPQPVREPPQTYNTPAPPKGYDVQEEPPRAYNQPPQTPAPRVYETPPPACPNGGKRHPATGDCLVNECENGSHDCDPNAKCVDTFDGYTCACQSGYFDQSEVDKPGRVCVLPLDNCASGRSGCDPNAVCTDTYNGVSCRCKNGFVDLSDDRSRPGRKCQKLLNECANPTLNTCSKFAECIDELVGYRCQCKQGYKDVDPSNPGRECQEIALPLCQDPAKNNCHKDADCVEDATKPQGFTCKCRAGFLDKSPDSALPGRVCVPTPRCANSDCDPAAVCKETEDGYTCTCPADMRDVSPEKETKPGRKCEKTITSNIALVIVRNGEESLPYSSKYASPTNTPYHELADKFTKDLGQTIADTRYGPAYIQTEVSKIASPKSVEPSLDGGLIINSTVHFDQSAGAVNACQLFDAVVEKIQASGGFVGSGQLKVGDDVVKLHPCPKVLCGGKVCNTAHRGGVSGREAVRRGLLFGQLLPGQQASAVTTCVNHEDQGECVCLPGFVDVRNVSLSLRTSAGLKEDQYCLRNGDLNYCLLGWHNCSIPEARCVPLKGGFRCECTEGYTDQNPEDPGHQCAAGLKGEDIVAAASTIPWWLMLLLALLFLLLTLCCCLWALSRLRWFRRRRGILDQSGSSYSDLVIPRPKVVAGDAMSMGSGSSEFTIREEIERRVVTDETEEEANEHEKYDHHVTTQNELIIR
ncbi:Transmembrane cell adhesion receptor mua 3 [Aphelenchoides fujianensis]|nr:Transmembrane cell adhesion receptor mua 3 [Aphelenchoides fujianensis]